MMDTQNSPAGNRPLGTVAFGWLALISVAGAGCASGPDFKRPDPPRGSGYTASPIPAKTAGAPVMLGASQRLNSGAVPAEWWREFGSPKVDDLVERALKSSPTLEAARATLRQARMNYEARDGSSRYPRLTANLAAQSQGVNGAAMGQPTGERTFDLFTANAAVSYNLDLSGGTRRALEALAAQADYQGFQFEGARLTLAANVVATAVTQARVDAQTRANERVLAAQVEQLAITRKRLALGAATQNDILAIQAQVEQTRAGVLFLRNQLERTNHLLAVLSGREPGDADTPQLTLEDFRLPAELPVRVPSELARRRPDIRASEALLHAANAQYGEAVSRRYPQITLSGSLGSQALSTASLFGAGSLVWSVAGQLAQPLFNPGLEAEARAGEAGLDAATANYRQTVLQALRDVADVLRSLDTGAQTLAAKAAADASARESLTLAEKRESLGAASRMETLSARQKADQTRVDLIAAQAQRLADSVALYQAMGGGWIDDGAVN